MQVSVESTQGLERKLTVQVPAERIDQEVETRLRSLAKRARIDGFRPGKVPFSVVRKRFGSDVRGEVMGEVIQSTFFEAVTQENLKPAGAPQVEPKEGEGGEGFEYVATFEVYPEVVLGDASAMSVLKPVTEIADADIDAMIDSLRNQRKGWTDVERAAAEGDRVTIDFVGSIDGEEFPGGKGEKHPLQLGSNSFIPGFEDQLVGVKAGDEKTVDVNFPEDYQSADLAGKAAQFAVTVHSVAEATLPELDDEFFKGFGLEEPSLENFRAEIRKSMEREVERRMHSLLKERLMDAVLEANPVEVPKALIEEEITRLQQQMQQQMAQQYGGGQAPELNLPRNLFEGQANKRVSLGLLMSEIVKTNEIKVDADRVRKTIENFAADYDDPEQVVTWYYSQKEQLAAVESSVLEDQVVDFLLEQAQVSDETLSYEELMQPKPRDEEKED
jgi:trigger factor